MNNRTRIKQPELRVKKAVKREDIVASVTRIVLSDLVKHTSCMSKGNGLAT